MATPTPPHYSYRVDHDLGFAPHVERRLCTLCGCKKSTIERWARPGSWIIGVGGRKTGKSNALIYAMQVENVLSYRRLQKRYKSRASYLHGHGILASAPVLISSRSYYFGDHALNLPKCLAHMVQRVQGCKRISEKDIELLKVRVLDKFSVGKHGEPNNASPAPKKCSKRGASTHCR